MKVRAECAPCLLRRVLYETRLVAPNTEEVVLGKCLPVLADAWDADETSTTIATKVHRCAYDLLGTADPYKELKALSNRISLELLPKAKRKVAQSRKRLRDAALGAIIGNVLDFGIRSTIESPEALRERFEALWAEGLYRDDTLKLVPLLKEGAEVVYLADNCGEILFDTILMEELRARGARLTLVVRGAPILTDATMVDVEGLGIDSHVDEVITTERFAVGIPIDPMPMHLRERLSHADLIVSKGMANYEALSEQGFEPIIYLMRTKCRPVAESIGEPVDKNIAKLIG
ncbi:MAG: ARMT1-like domain-containing protein [Candidatus Thermoplasmatota archaeon]